MFIHRNPLSLTWLTVKHLSMPIYIIIEHYFLWIPRSNVLQSSLSGDALVLPHVTLICQYHTESIWSPTPHKLTSLGENTNCQQQAEFGKNGKSCGSICRRQKLNSRLSQGLPGRGWTVSMSNGGKLCFMPSHQIRNARFLNHKLPFCQIWIIFTQLELWTASARHNLGENYN